MKCVFISLRNYLRCLYYKKQRRRLTNTTPTIISRDCFGGLIYHNLGLQFRSPTINLYFSKEDFVTFCNNIPLFLDAELIEEKDETVSFPVGILCAERYQVRINFMHYSTFEEAKNKWNERKQRVDFANIYIIQFIEHATEKDLEDFETIPYEKKVLITDNNITHSNHVFEHEILKSKNYTRGLILGYPNAISLRRYMDSFDYVEFLNT